MATIKQKKAVKKIVERKWNKEQKEIRHRKRIEKLFRKSILGNSWLYLYLIKCHKYYKIGITFDIENRLNSLQCGNPYELKVIIAVKNPDAKEIEEILHKKFEHKRVMREWFELSQKDIDFIIKPIKDIYEKKNRTN